MQAEYKSSYDDLIDEHAVPFRPNNGHQTFSVETPINGERRGSSYPIHERISSKQSFETSEAPSNLSYPPLPPTKEPSPRRLWEKILPESLACRLFFITVLIETTIDLAIEGELLLRLRQTHGNSDDASDMSSRKMPVYLAVFALAHVFQLVMAVDAINARNTLQFICLIIFNALFLVYAIVQINEVRQAISDPSTVPSAVSIDFLTATIPVVISVTEVAYIGLGWKIYHEFGWKVYKFLGADRRIKKMYANYQIYECLIKFDVFFWVGFSVQFIRLVLVKSDWEYYVTWAALPLSIILLVEGHLAARHENKWMMLTFMSGCVGAMFYFIYKLIKVLLHNETDQFKFIWKSLTVFSIISIILLFITFVFSIIVMRNFGRGLRSALERKNAAQHSRFASQSHRRATSTNLNRMSIS